MAKFSVERVDIKRTELQKLSAEEITFFIFAGHILNELTFLQKIVMACSNRNRRLLKRKRRDARWRAELDANSAQMFIAQRLTLGKIYEAKLFLANYAFKKPWFKELTRSFSEEGKSTLRNLRRAHARDKKKGESSLIKAARDKFGFHYYIPPVLHLVSKDSHLPDIFRMYLTDHMGSSLYMGSEEAITHTYSSWIAGKRNSLKTGIGRTYDTLLSRQRSVQNLLGECISAFIFPSDQSRRLKYKRQSLKMSEKYNVRDFEIPWFIPKQVSPEI